jgi:hypothetical protein
MAWANLPNGASTTSAIDKPWTRTRRSPTPARGRYRRARREAGRPGQPQQPEEPPFRDRVRVDRSIRRIRLTIDTDERRSEDAGEFPATGPGTTREPPTRLLHAGEVRACRSSRQQPRNFTSTRTTSAAGTRPSSVSGRALAPHRCRSTRLPRTRLRHCRLGRPSGLGRALRDIRRRIRTRHNRRAETASTAIPGQDDARRGTQRRGSARGRFVPVHNAASTATRRRECDRGRRHEAPGEAGRS